MRTAIVAVVFMALSVMPIKAKNIKVRSTVKTGTGDTIAYNAANRYLFKGIRVTKNIRQGIINIDFKIKDSVNFSALDVCFLVVFFDYKRRFLYKMITPEIRRMSNTGRWCGITLKVDVAILRSVKYIEIGVIPHIDLN